MAGAIAGGLVSGFMANRGSKKAAEIGKMIVPDEINTGRSTYDTGSGEATLDPSIRRNQNINRYNIRSLTGTAQNAFDQSAEGIRSLRGNLSTLADDYIGNQSAYREAQLMPLQEQISKAGGELDRELGRTNVRGTFADKAKAGFDFDAGMKLRQAEAQIENERINALGDFLQIDADLLKQGLTSETGRVGMLAQLEGIISGMNSEQFSQEMQLLGLPTQFIPGTTAAANVNANAEGIKSQVIAGGVGDIMDAIGNSGSNSSGGGYSNYTGSTGGGSLNSGNPNA